MELYSLTRSDFIELATQEGCGKSPTIKLIPIFTEIIADMETPVSVFLKVRQGPNAFLLESVESGERMGRYSFIGIKPYAIFSSKGKDVEITECGIEWNGKEDDPISALKDFLERFSLVKVQGLPGFTGGAVGYMSYDMVRSFQKLPEKAQDTLELPDSIFLIVHEYFIFDHVTHKLKIVCNVAVKDDLGDAYDRTIRRLDALVEMVHEESFLPNMVNGLHSLADDDLGCSVKAGFEEKINKAKKYIADGDVFQVVLSKRLETRLKSDSFDLYRALRVINPSPYMFYLDFEHIKLVGSSPEVLVKVGNDIVELNPIAGTRPRGQTTYEDELFERELLNDEKEKAEHMMLVDLGIDDLERICEYVQVNELMAVEKYSHVMHMVSKIKGKLKGNLDSFDVLRATFPAGTVSGAPKIRAMEIIEELELDRRGPYAGGVGYFSFSGNMDMCIAIRTIVVKGDRAFVQAGAGIVAHSVPEKEYFEVLNKAKALLKAVKMANETFKMKGGGSLTHLSS